MQLSIVCRFTGEGRGEVKPVQLKRKSCPETSGEKANRHNSEGFALLWLDTTSWRNAADKKEGHSMCTHKLYFQSHLKHRPENTANEKAEQNQQLQ